ncbi:MAG: hypothetical protein DA330_09440 [Nitrososphaera sp.]|nr:hypothetical protein [Nitrososphaera sp.]
MPFNLEDLQKAMAPLSQFRALAVSPHHERFSFPFFSGTYFTYRKIDVMRVVAIAQSVSRDPSYLDVGCGYGDFLKRVREFLPKATGLEKDASIYYGLGIEKPDYISISDAHWIDKRYDVIFVGWMEPGQDFRDSVARNTDVIITTLDQGISLAAEFDGHSFERIAWWRTPSWEDVNIEIMNKYYSSIPAKQREALSKMRGAHNFWYVYCRPEKSGQVRKAIESLQEKDEQYDFESVLDELGFARMQKLENPAAPEPLWQIQFDQQDLKRLQTGL